MYCNEMIDYSSWLGYTYTLASATARPDLLVMAHLLARHSPSVLCAYFGLFLCIKTLNGGNTLIQCGALCNTHTHTH